MLEVDPFADSTITNFNSDPDSFEILKQQFGE